MAQDLVSISLEKFKVQVPMMSLGILKDLYFRVIQWKRNWGDKIDVQAFYSMLRKEAVIHRELTRRKLTDNQDFQRWKGELQNYMTRDGRIVHLRRNK